MKYTYLLLLQLALLLFYSQLSYSQITFGVKSGMNIATTKDLTAIPKNRIAWYAGVVSIIPLQNKFFLQSELLYSSKGHRSPNEIGRSNITLRVNYINLPIMVGYKIDRKTSLLIGPELGYLINAKLKIADVREPISVSKNYAPNVDLGMDIAVNYKLKKNFSVGVCYCYGFKLLYYIDNAGVRHDEIKGGNRVFQIGLNYSL